jgi:hypothetical protein
VRRWTRWARVLGFVGLWWMACCWMVAGQSMPTVGTQSVLLNLPESFHVEELTQVLQQFVNAEADIYVSSIHTLSTADVTALQSDIPARFFNLMAGSSGGPRVTVISASEQLERHFDKVVFLGGGWYDEYFKPSGYTESRQPDYADDLYAWTQQLVTENVVIGAIGAGLYPLVYSGILEPGTLVPVYPCDDLVDVVIEQGYTPITVGQTPRSDGSWPPIVDADVYVGDAVFVEGARAVMSPIPNSWYDTTQQFGNLLVDDHSWGYIDAITTLENTHYQVTLPSAIEIRLVKTEADGYIVVGNASESPVNLEGWKLQTVDPMTGEILHTYTFENYVLEGSAEVMVIVGTQSWDPAHINWTTDNVWSPNGGKIVLVDPQGNVRAAKVGAESE